MNDKRAFGMVLIFFIVFLSYGPMKTEIHDLATNANTTNAVMEFFDAWFGLFWALLGALILGLMVYELAKS